MCYSGEGVCHAGVRCVIFGWSGSCRVGCVIQDGVCHAGLGYHSGEEVCHTRVGRVGHAGLGEVGHTGLGYNGS